MSQKNVQSTISSMITNVWRWKTRSIFWSDPIYARKKSESKLFMIIIEVPVIQADSDEKCSNDDNETESSEREVVEKLILRTVEWLLDIAHSPDIECDLDKSREKKYLSMDIVEDDEEYQIDEWECEHTPSIGKSIRNSREYLYSQA